MQELKRKYVIPGDKIVDGNFRPLMNVIRIGDSIISTRIGIAEAGRDGIKVIPLSGVYIPRINDIVIGKIVDRSSLSWDVDINSCFSAHLPAQDVFGRDFSPARDDMNREMATGDLITARIIAFDRTRDPMLTVQDRDLGKIPRGESLKISATRVPRLIGKRGSMIQTIEQATQTRVIIGQNGVVVVTGRSQGGIELAVKAIKMVEEEAHTSNLTQRIKVLLNVPDTTPAQPQLSQSTSSSVPAAMSATSKDISEVSPTKSELQSAPNDIQQPVRKEQQSQDKEEQEQQPSSRHHLGQEKASVSSSDSSPSSSSPTSADAISLHSSHSKSRSQDERGRKSDDQRSVAGVTGGDTRKAKTYVKGVHEGLQEHDKKEANS
ncbi:MAG: exosome complex RNA-binding protein Rrp4 [Nitrososphaeraceae archaeon]|jgi:exosome complex component RRP4